MMNTNTGKKIKGGNRIVDHQEDRLSNMPDEILIKILSYLDTREAVRSGSVSTRWKSVWESVPVLDLHQCYFNFRCDVDHKREKVRFLNFMEQVLIARKLPCLEKIRIRGDKCDPYILRLWMRAALERNANELDINFSLLPDDYPFELTNSLFSHNKLVILKLRVDMTLNFQANSSGFPNLKVLLLDSIIYRDDNSLPNLLSGCPILEDLIIIRGREDDIRTLNLISNSVKRLTVDNELGIHIDKMVFDAPALEYLHIYCFRTEFLVKDLSHIVDAKFEIGEFSCLFDMCKLLGDISNVTNLRFLYSIIEATERPSDYDFPMFYNLTSLKMYGNDNDDYDYTDSKILQWELLIEILKCSPMLENLIYQAYADDCEELSKASDWDIPNCLLSSLKSVKFNSFTRCDIERVRYFLLYGRVLK